MHPYVMRFEVATVFFIDGTENPADLLTKNLPHEKFAKFKVQLGLQFPSCSS